ncbi:MAG: hypothetical protein ACFFEF_07785 [Candidatus Thorarchaeota archaeon]
MTNNSCMFSLASNLILGAYILKGTGERLYAVSYEGEERTTEEFVPPHVQACVSLFHSRESTVLGQPYTLEQNGVLWVYTFFESFAVALQTTEDEDIASLSRRMASLGRELAHSFGKVLRIWSGDMGEIEGMDDLVDKYITLDFDISRDSMAPILDSVVDHALLNYDLAFAGVIDAKGNMLSGNIPENHLSYIQDKLLREAIKPSIDVVPTDLTILGYDIQMLRVHSLTVIVAPHRDGSRVGAKTAISEIAQSLSESLS